VDDVVTPRADLVEVAVVRRARVAIGVIFLVTGAVFGTWVSRVPSIKEQISAGTGPLGAALLGIAVGAVLARPWCGQLVARLGSGPVTRVAIALCCAALVLPALAGNALGLGFALAGLGAGLGSIDVAMNAHAVAVQTRIGRPIMSSFHGVYSIGGLIGSLLGGRAYAYGLSPLAHFSLAAIVLGCVALVSSWWLLPSGSDVASKAVRAGRWVGLPAGRRLPLIVLGIVGLCSLAAEGAVGDWGAVYLHENLDAGAALASSGFAAYSLAMVVGRLFGDRLVARWDEWSVITWMTLLAGGGFAVALVVARPVAAVAGFMVLGVGLSLVVPITFSKAGQLGGDTAGPAVTVVSLISGVGPIAVPPIIGFLAEGIGLPAALATVSVLAFVAVGLMRVVQRMLHPPVPQPLSTVD
jgi:fucose permease